MPIPGTIGLSVCRSWFSPSLAIAGMPADNGLEQADSFGRPFRTHPGNSILSGGAELYPVRTAMRVCTNHLTSVRICQVQEITGMNQ